MKNVHRFNCLRAVVRWDQAGDQHETLPVVVLEHGCFVKRRRETVRLAEPGCCKGRLLRVSTRGAGASDQVGVHRAEPSGCGARGWGGRQPSERWQQRRVYLPLDLRRLCRLANLHLHDRRSVRSEVLNQGLHVVLRHSVVLVLGCSYSVVPSSTQLNPYWGEPVRRFTVRRVGTSAIVTLSLSP